MLEKEEHFLESPWATGYADTPYKEKLVLNILGREPPKQVMELCSFTQQYSLGAYYVPSTVQECPSL